jgi:hypothetical protein
LVETALFVAIGHVTIPPQVSCGKTKGSYWSCHYSASGELWQDQGLDYVLFLAITNIGARHANCVRDNSQERRTHARKIVRKVSATRIV